MFKLINSLPGDLTHDISQILLRNYVIFRSLCFKKLPEIPITKLCNYRLRNPIGIGAGIDKNGDLLKNFLKIGLGFITLGSVTLHPRQGNPKPRIYKMYGKKLMINSMGLPSRGVYYLIRNLRKYSKYRHRDSIIIVSIAGSKLEDYLKLTHILNSEDFQILEVNISCPNVEGVEYWRDLSELERLIKEITSVSRKKVIIKLPPLSSEYTSTQFKETLKLLHKHDVDGVCLSNTLSVRNLDRKYIAAGLGGLSGRILYNTVKVMIKIAKHNYGDDLDIIAMGGVLHGHQMCELLKLGADAVGIVTAFAFQGPYAIYRLVREFLKTYENS